MSQTVTEVRSRSGATLTPTFVSRGHSSWQYFHDEEGNLWGSRKGTPPRFVAQKGRWIKDPPSVGVLNERFAPEASAPESPVPEPPGPLAEEEKARRRFAFCFPAQLSGVQGELTIEADTLKEAKDTLEEVKLTAKKYPHLGIVVGVVTKQEDEYFILLADGTAFCRKHQAPMSKRMKQGDEWHSHNAGTEASPCYCRGRPGPDSPGWRVK